MSCQIKCSKGTKENDVTILKFEDKDLSVTDSGSKLFLSLADVRKRLIAEKFIGTDKDKYVWRFVSSKVKPDEKGKVRYSDRIIGTQTEELYPAKKLIINNENEIIITNVEAVGRPDLIGFATDYFNNGKIKVTCRLRKNKTGDKQKNAGKFEPLMMTDLISTRENDDVNYKFACVCCEDSVVEFPVEGLGSLGIVIKAELNNEIIYSRPYRWAEGKHDLYGRGLINCIEREGKTFDIVVKNLSKDSSVVPGQEIRYQKITIYAHDLLSYYDRDKVKEITIEDSRANDKINAVEGATYRISALGMANDRIHTIGTASVLSVDSEKTQIVVPKDSSDPGKIEEGEPVDMEYGNWYWKRYSENRLGSVNIYMFVFKSLDEAEKVIGRYNALTESRQAEYWGMK